MPLLLLLLLLCLLVVITRAPNTPWLQHGSSIQLPSSRARSLLQMCPLEALWEITWIHLQAYLQQHHRPLSAPHHHPWTTPSPPVQESLPLLCMDTLSQVRAQRLHWGLVTTLIHPDPLSASMWKDFTSSHMKRSVLSGFSNNDGFSE